MSVSRNLSHADPQSETDPRGIALDSVGVCNVCYPISIAGWESDPRLCEKKETLISLQVSLPAEARGIHMSRLLEVLHHWQGPLSPSTLPAFLRELRHQQNAQRSTMTCKFTWFISRPAPRTNRPAWQGIETIWHASQAGEASIIGYTLRIPVTTLCPCSQAISDYGAHSQRGWLNVKLEWDWPAETVAPREIFDKLQHAGSAPIYPLLKRADERHVTMLAYEQPAFVEDTARHAAQLLIEDSRVSRFYLEVCNEESIHTHDVMASLSFRRQ